MALLREIGICLACVIGTFTLYLGMLSAFDHDWLIFLTVLPYNLVFVWWYNERLKGRA
tara:strand:- start:2021 stop:2194 length:174 start_codon:yes stop_codon:yes gene_type:complete